MLGRIVKGLVILVVVLVVLIGALFAGARFHDGPLGVIPGGALEAGELVASPPDWRFAKDVQEVELQLAYEKTSRTTWILVRDDGTAYIPCNLSFPPGKRWHHAADQNGEAIVRVDGKRYPVTLKRVQDEAQATEVGKVAVAKYPEAPRSAAGGVWFFKLEPRIPAAM